MQHKVQLDSHDVDSGTDCWTFKPSFGVVHAEGCSICNSYMRHLIIANNSNIASFQAAIRDRECIGSKAFLDGAQNGWQLQQECDVALDHYREKFDKAMQSLEQHQKLLETAKQEIRELQDQTLALQVQLDSSVPSTIKRSAQTDPSWIERLLLQLSEDADRLDALLPLSSTADTPPIIPDPPTVSGDTTSVPSFSVSRPSNSFDSVGRMNSSAEHGSQPSKPRKPKYEASTHTQRPEPPAPDRLEPMPEPSAPNQLKPTPEPPVQNQLKPIPEAAPEPAMPISKPPTPTSFSIETAQDPPITSIAQLQSLIDDARAGDVSAEKRVKRFSGAAYQITPVSLRTELQHYVVKHWRKNPRYPSVPAQRKAVGVSFQKEIYVDASRWGIGFVMDGMCSAWKFSDSLAHSSDLKFDICLAEMIAVEVGLLTVIHWVTTMIQNEGEKLPLEIDVRCDNKGVVTAVKNRVIACERKQDVLRRICKFVRTFNVQLSIKWIASAQNLADGPSRGIPCHRAAPLPCTPSLPSYLSDILNPISTNENDGVPDQSPWL